MTLREVADRTGGWVAPEAAGIEIHGVASLADANPGDLAFFGNPKYIRALRKSRATAVLVPHGFGEDVPATRIWVDHPAAAFASLLPVFAPAEITHPAGTHPTAVISPEAQVDAAASVGPFVVVEPGACVGARTILGAHSYIGHGVRIGDDCHLYPRVTIRERCVVGHRVCLHSGVVLGADGFGYEFRDGRQQKIPQTGIVQVDDDVEIGANSTVDRARFGRTWIQKGTKIDNLVQIGHNVTIGEHSILCAQVGVSGSTRIGNYVTLAGKVGVNGHIEIGDRAIAIALTGISKDVPPGEVIGGIPAQPLRDFKRLVVHKKHLDKLYRRVEALEKKTSVGS